MTAQVTGNADGDILPLRVSPLVQFTIADRRVPAAASGSTLAALVGVVLRLAALVGRIGCGSPRKAQAR